MSCPTHGADCPGHPHWETLLSEAGDRRQNSNGLELDWGDDHVWSDGVLRRSPRARVMGYGGVEPDRTPPPMDVGYTVHGVAISMGKPTWMILTTQKGARLKLHGPGELTHEQLHALGAAADEHGYAEARLTYGGEPVLFTAEESNRAEGYVISFPGSPSRTRVVWNEPDVEDAVLSFVTGSPHWHDPQMAPPDAAPPLEPPPPTPEPTLGECAKIGLFLRPGESIYDPLITGDDEEDLLERLNLRWQHGRPPPPPAGARKAGLR